ncbi:hypothetical protein GC102_37195 [Paenibacillus sp. LMG 31460]|uniref:Uncharacterized protein n=1 Tax=Paenibacillus germinis TaxID=2654979 RepID=A0ABX1ZDC3_9BACL|nr:hypothetical protein [Paenibacillus germinis]NOU91323.1 hypothetical protein [Paenibacillus germinis]
MLFHDINPKLMYVEQHGKQVIIAKEAQSQGQKQFSFILKKLVRFFRINQNQSACCACACS